MTDMPPQNNYRILLVEDSIANAELFIAMLGRLGYNCHHCDTGAAALNALRAGRFDLALMDIRLPDTNGIEVTRAIREQLKIGNDAMPIIALTAYSAPSDITSYLEVGMDDYLNKPLKMKDLERVLEEWLVRGAGSFDAFVWGFEHSYDDPPDLDVDAMQSFIGFMGKDKLRDMLRQFKEDYVQREADIRSGGHDSRSLQPLLHPLIATAASMGLMRLSGLCRDIMDQCQDPAYSPPAELADQLNACYREGMQALAKHIDGR